MTLKTLSAKTIIITGASSGIGEALALAYAAAGIRLYLIGRDHARLDAIAEKALQQGAEVSTAAIDVRDQAAMTAQLESWDDQTPIDLIIANAGVSGGSHAGESGSGGTPQPPSPHARDIFDINLTGMLNTIHPLLPRMTARGHGQIALMSSMAGWRGMPNAPAYSASKVAVRAYGEALYPLLKKQGVSLSVIYPGFIRTPLTDANRFRMPFMLEARQAALLIRQGLEKGQRRIAFPKRMLAISRLIAALPIPLGDWILMRAPKK